MKVYLAAGFSRKQELGIYRSELVGLGIEVTSRWLDEVAAPNSTLDQFPDAHLMQTAADDINDIYAADVLVHFTVEPTDCIKRAGATFEAGFALGKGRTLITVGPRQHIFAYLPAVRNFQSWPEARAFLVEHQNICQ